MSNFKSILGYDDNLSSRRQDIAPTQYAISKLRAARTPRNQAGAIIQNLNQIIFPDLYVIELSNAVQNMTDSDGNRLTQGIVYLYQIIVDPDESLHGGHVSTPSEAIMCVRQIAYYQNGSTEKILTRIGYPLSSYSGSTVELLSNVTIGQAGYVYVNEIGMWVRHSTAIELAVNWTAWKEFGGSGNPVYEFLDTVEKGVSLNVNGNTIKAEGHPATATEFGVVKVLNSVSNIQAEDLLNYVPTATAVYHALMSISQNIAPLRPLVENANTYANAAYLSATAANTTIQNHIANHPTATNADYTLVNGVATNQTLGTVKTVPYLSKVDNAAAAKYTVPTVNAICVVSQEVGNYVNAVSKIVSTISSSLDYHLANHPDGGSIIGSATYDDFGTVKIASAIENYPYDFYVPPVRLLCDTSSNLSNYVTRVSASIANVVIAHVNNAGIHGGAGLEGTDPIKVNGNKVSLKYLTTVSNGVRLQTFLTNDGYKLAAVASRANVDTVGTVKTTNTIGSSNEEHVVPTITALWSVSSALSAHANNAEIHGGGGGGVNNGVEPLYITNTNSMAVSTAKVIDSDPSKNLGVVNLTDTIVSCYYNYTVPTATAVWAALQNLPSNPVGSGGINAPSYEIPSSWSWTLPSTGMRSLYAGTVGPGGGWILISIACGVSCQGCVGISINGQYIPLFGGSGTADTKLLPMPAGATFTIYDGTGGGASVLATGYGMSYWSGS